MVRTLALLFLMGQPSPSMALPVVARRSSRAVTGLQRAHAKFFVTSETRPPFMGLSTVEAGIPVDIYPSPTTCNELTPRDLLTRPAFLAVMPCLLTVGMKGTDHSAFSTLDIPGYLGGAPEYNLLNTSNLYTRLRPECINQLSAYACCAFPQGVAPRAAERESPRLLGDSMCKAPSKIFPWRTAMMSLLLLSPLSSEVRVGAFVFASLGYTEATVCPHCKDTILPAAHVATACPLVAELTNNAAIFTARKLGSSPTVVHSLTHELAAQFTRPVIDAIVGLACAPVHGLSIDFTDAAYTQASAVVKAAVYGHCSFAEASAILSERLDNAPDMPSIEKIRGAMDSLKTSSEAAVNTATGTLLFIWAKISNVFTKRLDFTYKLEAAGKSKATSYSVVLVRPETEAEFYEMCHLFVMTIVALGLASATIVHKFMDDVVFATVRMKESFGVAHELLICYFREIDFDPARALHMGNVFRRGGQDTLLSEARRNAAAFFRTCGANPQLDGAKNQGDRATKTLKPDLKPNGKHDDSSKKPCPDFNAGRPCRTLKPDGSCVFAHKCNQFVSDKGPLGYCFGPHARCTGCAYADDKKLKSPAK
jgi:hypothetical protein